MKFNRNIILSTVVVTTLLSACGGAATTQAPASTSAAATEAPAMTEGAAKVPAKTEAAGAGVMLPEVDPAAYEGFIVAAGSSTVFPIAEVMRDRFLEEGFAGEITIDSIGSGAGLERFCVSGETDIANASRAIKDSEIESCQAIGREPVEFLVGIDALAVVVSQENDFLTDLSLADLAKVFSKDAVKWSDINPSYPAEDILRYVPGTDSGTFDFFIEFVMQPAYGDDTEAARQAFLETENLNPSEDDNVLVAGVESSPYAIGFFGYAYYQENADLLKTVSIDGVEATGENAESGAYPLARPLYLYSDATILKDKPQVAAYINFFLTYVNEEIESIGYFPASSAALDEGKAHFLEAVQ